MALVSLRANYLFCYGFVQKHKFLGGQNLHRLVESDREQKRFAAPCCRFGFYVGGVGVDPAGSHRTHWRPRSARAATYPDATQELKEIDAKLDGVKTRRVAAQIDAALAALLARPITVDEGMSGTLGKISGSCR
jgi:hypothetical protein